MDAVRSRLQVRFTCTLVCKQCCKSRSSADRLFHFRRFVDWHALSLESPKPRSESTRISQRRRRTSQWRRDEVSCCRISAGPISQTSPNASRLEDGRSNNRDQRMLMVVLQKKITIEHTLAERDVVDGPLTPRNVCSTNSGVIGAILVCRYFLRLRFHVLVLKSDIYTRFVVSHACIFGWYLLSVVRAVRRTG